MKLIQPHKKSSTRVEDWKSIASTAKEMVVMVNKGGFPGKYPEGLALSHAQVSEHPRAFFVVHDNVAEAFGGFSVMCNARIVKVSNMVHFKEACLSYPFRDVINTKRYDHVIIEAEVHNPLKSFLSNGLSTREFELYGVAAFIAQHEIDHAKGLSIHDKFKK